MQPRLLNDDIQRQLNDLFKSELVNPVEIVLFSSENNCETCAETEQLLDELAALSNLVFVSTVDIDQFPELTQRYQIERVPTLVIAGKDDEELFDYGIRFSGIPSGYEFSSLIHSIELVSRRDSGLSPEIRSKLKTIDTPINLKIFVTPT